MKLNLPTVDQLSECENLLIAGAGGGFDIFCGLPIYFELRERGQQAHLASLSFADVRGFNSGIRLTESLVGVTAEHDGPVVYFPELHLSRWFQEKHEESIAIWCFHKTGVRPLWENYKVLLAHLGIDGILLVDGGVDSLLHGDESDTGSLIEDATSLCAVNKLTDVGTRLLCCTALGAELGIAHAHIFENVPELTAAGAFLGACFLTPQQEAYQAYEEAVLYAQSQRFQDPSVINSSLISAVQGHYGDYHLTEKTRGSQLWISPLMALYWFFDLPCVAAQNGFLGQLRHTQSFMDALEAFMLYIQHVQKRPYEPIPLA